MRKTLWPIIAVTSLVLSTYAFILGSKVIEKTQNSSPIYITYPEGYTDLPEAPKYVPKNTKSKAKPKSR